MVKITKAFIDKVEPPAEGYVNHWDDYVKGYGLRVTSAGKKVFVAQGRVQGKAVLFTIGPFGTYTEDKARKRAQAVLQGMREGIDPRSVQKHEKAIAVTLRQVANDYIQRPGKLKPRSIEAIERHVATTFKAWEHLPVVNITEEMCRARYKEIAEKGLLGNRKGGSPGQANQAFDILRALLNYSARQFRRGDGSPLIQRNPTEMLGDHRVKLKPRSNRFIPTDKVGEVWAMLTTARANAVYETERTSLDLVMFMLLTGTRKEETSSLRWEHVHLADEPSDCRWFIPEVKRKRGSDIWLPLSSQAVAILRRRQRTDSPFVFASNAKKGYMDQPRAALQKVAAVAGLHLSNHDMRRTLSNIALGPCRIEKFRTDMLTGHMPAASDMTARHYLDTFNLAWLHPEIQMIGDWIEQQGLIAATKADGGNVVSLPARA